jgi:hypothetical protein
VTFERYGAGSRPTFSSVHFFRFIFTSNTQYMSALQNSDTELKALEQTQLVDQPFSTKLHVPATDFAEECPVTLSMPTDQWEDWKSDQERRFACKFHDQTPKYTYRRKTNGTGGRPATNIFYRVFRCHRRGHYQSQAKQRKAATSIRCGCEAMFTVTCKKSTPETVHIKYHWRHTGHQPGTPSDLAKTPIDKEAREWIRQRVEEGMDWRGIKQLLKTEQEIMFKVMNLCFIYNMKTLLFCLVSLCLHFMIEIDSQRRKYCHSIQITNWIPRCILCHPTA